MLSTDRGEAGWYEAAAYGDSKLHDSMLLRCLHVYGRTLSSMTWTPNECLPRWAVEVRQGNSSMQLGSMWCLLRVRNLRLRRQGVIADLKGCKRMPRWLLKRRWPTI